MKKLKNLCRLSSTVLAISLMIVGTNLTAFANENVDGEESFEEIADMATDATADVEESLEETSYMDNEVVHISADGKISYETIPVTREETSAYSNDDIVILNDTPSTVQSDDVMATASSTALEDVPVSFVGTTPYINMCLITATFPNGESMDSSGILISKNLVLASAHGIYNHEKGGAATHVDIGIGTYFSGSKKIAQLGTQSWNGAYLRREWTENQLSEYDWSLVILSQNTITYEKCGYVPDITKAKGKAIKTIGYPGIDRLGSVYFKYSTGEITGTTDSIFSNEKYKNLWYISAETSNGMSGGPIIEQSSGIVIGVIQGHISNIIGVQRSAAVPLTKVAADTIQQYAVW